MLRPKIDSCNTGKRAAVLHEDPLEYLMTPRFSKNVRLVMFNRRVAGSRL